MSETGQHQVNNLELVASRIGQQEICIDIQSVREIRGWSPATTLPHAPDHVMGAINLRGTVLPVVDLANRLGLGRTDPTARHVIIVVQFGKKLCGLLVDAVSEILTVPPEKIQQTPDVDSELARRFVAGVIADQDRMLTLVRLEHVLTNGLEAA